MWTVADVSIPDAGIPSRRMPAWDVWFKRFADIGPSFLCDCTSASSIAPGGRVPICDHIMAVAFHMARIKGPWEEDRALMEKGWELVSGRKREKPNYTVRRDDASPFSDSSFLVYEPGIGGVRVDTKISNRGIDYACPCGGRTGDPCDHIESVINFLKDEASNYSTKGTSSDREVTFRSEDLEAMKKAMLPGKPLITATDEASRKFQETTEALKELSLAYREMADRQEPEEHKEPEDPKKPRSRFSEIDL